jgi:hypothetical protein
MSDDFQHDIDNAPENAGSYIEGYECAIYEHTKNLKFFSDIDFVLLYVEYSAGPIKFAGAGLRSFALLAT